MLVEELAKQYVKKLNNEEKRKKEERKQSKGKKPAFNEKLEESGFEKSRKERKIQGII